MLDERAELPFPLSRSHYILVKLKYLYQPDLYAGLNFKACYLFFSLHTVRVDCVYGRTNLNFQCLLKD